MRDIAKAVLRLAAGVVLLVGLPAALTVAVGWPLPHTIPSLDQISRAFDRRDVPVDVAVNTLAVIVWIAWAQLAWAVLVEAVATAHGRQARQRAPVLPSVQKFASQLVASAVLVVSLLGSLRSAGAAPHLEHPELIALEAVDQVPAPAPPAAPPAAGEYIVRHGDTYWGLAQQHLGDGTRWREIRDANIGRTVAPGQVITAQTDDLYPGWRLLLPTTSTPPRPATDPPAAPTNPPIEAIVRAGDNLWSIAADQLAAQLGRPPTDAEVTPYWHQLIDANIPRLTSGDPDLIYPDENLVLPAPATRLAPATATPPPAQPSTQPPGAPSTPPATTATIPPTTQRSPITTVAPAAPTPLTASTPSAPSTTVAHSQPDPDDEPADDPSPGPGLDVTVVGGSALFGGLVLATLARRRASRRRAAHAGSTVPPVLEEDIDLEHACALTAGRTLEHAWAAARALGPALAALDDPPTITALVVGPGDTVTIHLDRPSAVRAPFRPGPLAAT
jgi:nucleoid-associated protein YgaU